VLVTKEKLDKKSQKLLFHVRAEIPLAEVFQPNSVRLEIPQKLPIVRNFMTIGEGGLDFTEGRKMHVPIGKTSHP
jgi:hypothetical protein